MSWPHLHYCQTDLPSLCRDRPLETVEYHSQNTLYGCEWLIKHYAGLPLDVPLPWAMEHTITFANPEPYYAQVQTCLPCVLAVNEAQASSLRACGRPWVEPIGFVFHYMKQMFHQRHPELPLINPPNARRGTLVFPDKSTRMLDTDFDRVAFSQKLLALPEEFHPLAISVFWRDYERGTHQAFADAGIRLVSSGNPYDPEFLFRQYDLCRQFRYACANDLSTSFCLSVLAGCEFFHLPGGDLRVIKGGKLEDYTQDPTLTLPGKQACLAVSPFPPAGNYERQLALAEEFSGQAFMRSPAFFRELADQCQPVLQALRPKSLVLGHGQTHDHLALWQPRGFDNDGWAQKSCSLVIPANHHHGGVLLHLEIPARPDKNWQAIWQITIGEAEPLGLLVEAGTRELSLPCPTDGKPCRVTIESADEIPMTHDARTRSFRLSEIKWIESQVASLRSWELRRYEDAWLPQHLPAPLSFSPALPSHDSFLAWMPQGLYSDGWAEETLSLTLPPLKAAKTLRLVMQVPGRAEKGWWSHWQVNGQSTKCFSHDFQIKCGTWELAIPCPASAKPTRVCIHSDSSFPLESGARHCTYLIKNLELVDEVSPALTLLPFQPRDHTASDTPVAHEMLHPVQQERPLAFLHIYKTAGSAVWPRLQNRFAERKIKGSKCRIMTSSPGMSGRRISPASRSRPESSPCCEIPSSAPCLSTTSSVNGALIKSRNIGLRRMPRCCSSS
jgi:hypothetical protein